MANAFVKASAREIQNVQGKSMRKLQRKCFFFFFFHLDRVFLSFSFCPGAVCHAVRIDNHPPYGRRSHEGGENSGRFMRGE